jgi:DNA-directed RNA polymerase subunit omega
MRIEETIADALEKVDQDKYILSVAMARRANELMKGAKPMYDADTKIDKFTTIALNEIARGLVNPRDLVE